MGITEKNQVKMIGVLPSQGADPIPVRLSTEAAGAGMIEKNQVRMVGVLPSQGADPILVSMEFPAGMCRIKTGTYTGDGTEGQAITGVGFRPKYVRIWPHPIAEATAQVFEKLDQSWGDYAMRTGDIYYFDKRIKSLDVDGFTVDSDGGHQTPNIDGIIYDYIALG